jgi:hypothetical protein
VESTHTAGEQELGAPTGFRLILDTGTFHGLTDEQRTAMGREVDAVAAADATVLLLVWPRRRRPLIRGAEREDVEAGSQAGTSPTWSRLRSASPGRLRS